MQVRLLTFVAEPALGKAATRTGAPLGACSGPLLRGTQYTPPMPVAALVMPPVTHIPVRDELAETTRYAPLTSAPAAASAGTETCTATFPSASRTATERGTLAAGAAKSEVEVPAVLARKAVPGAAP